MSAACPTDTNDDEWRIAGQQQAATIDGLYRLSLDATKRTACATWSWPRTTSRSALRTACSSPPRRPTGQRRRVAARHGHRDVPFRPAPETEREQVRFYSGSDSVEGACDAVVRARSIPREFAARIAAGCPDRGAGRSGALPPRRRAISGSRSASRTASTSAISAADLWSLPPAPGDFIVEIRSRRFQTLTYTKSTSDPEDITFFDRRRRRNISVYASADRLTAYGRSLRRGRAAPTTTSATTTLDVSFDPARPLARRPRAGAPARPRRRHQQPHAAAGREPHVRSIYSTEFGRLLPLRIRGQNNVSSTCHGFATRGTEMTLVVIYSGRLEPGEPDRESVAPQFPPGPPVAGDPRRRPGVHRAKSSLLYSTRTYWYPQGSVTDYATAMMHLTVPELYQVLASGELAPGSPVVVPGRDRQPAARLLHVRGGPAGAVPGVPDQQVHRVGHTRRCRWSSPRDASPRATARRARGTAARAARSTTSSNSPSRPTPGRCRAPARRGAGGGRSAALLHVDRRRLARTRA